MKDVIKIESPILTKLIGAFIKSKLKKSGIKIDDISIEYITLVRKLDDKGYRMHTKLSISMDDNELERLKGELK